MTAEDDKIQRRRLRAPRGHGQALIDPPMASAIDLLDENRQQFAVWNLALADRSLQGLAERARREVIELAQSYTAAYRSVDFQHVCQETHSPPRIVMTGHQLQLYHPGVWFKNFCLSTLAERTRAVGINLLVDNDTLRTASLLIPTGSTAEPRLEAVALDQPAEEIPFEERRIRDHDIFHTFGQRAADTIKPLIGEPIVKKLWPWANAAARESGETANLGRCVSRARHQLEEEWGLKTLEVPLSTVCETEAFRWFAIYLLAELPRFRDVYNKSLAEYRDVHRLRSRSHPVPDLASDGDWLEAPFWIWTKENPRRRRVFARQISRGLEITDRAELTISLDLIADTSFDAAVAQLERQSRVGVRLRPKALITTLYARTILSDLFLHGIGGAQYDLLTDAITRRFFGAEPLAFQTLTATAHLPIEHEVVTDVDLQKLHQQLRSLQFHPETHLPAQALDRDPQLQRWIRSKQQLFAEPATRTERVRRFHAIREINDALQPWLAPARDALIQQREELYHAARYHEVLNSREFSFCLFPEIFLRSLLLELSASTP